MTNINHVRVVEVRTGQVITSVEPDGRWVMVHNDTTDSTTILVSPAGEVHVVDLYVGETSHPVRDQHAYRLAHRIAETVAEYA
jgi:hypothetical protein